MALSVIRWSELDAPQRRDLLRRPALADERSVRQTAADVIARVRRDGDRALRELQAQFGAADAGGRARADIAVERAEIDSAGERLSTAQREAIQAAAANIEAFHAAQIPVDIEVDTADGVRCERVARAISRVGLYVPAGSAPLPSTALMLGLPARVAGCRLRVLCSPPQADGRVDAGVLYAASLCEIDAVFAVGGAQAIAALAYGTETIPQVDKIFGPGNPWVTAAKSLVSADPDGAAQDMPAGPSEVLVIADAAANPAFVAADLLSQAEHGTDSQAVLITDSTDLAQAVNAQIDAQLNVLSRRDVAARALEHSFALLVDNLSDAIAVANDYAPEHLILQLAQPRDWLEQIDSAGSVFLGPWAPESVGDYCSGTNHVLPTYGYARSYSSLGLNDFMRSMTVQELDRAGIGAIGPVAIELARLEGLDAHAQAVALRLAALER